MDVLLTCTIIITTTNTISSPLPFPLLKSSSLPLRNIFPRNFLSRKKRIL
jgi:hypothetical protein